MERLLLHPPSRFELERLYFELAKIGAPAVGRPSDWSYQPEGPEEMVALAAEMLRYDPRLLSILLQFFVEHWRELNPLQLRAAMRRMQWPQALLVVLEFARAATADPELRYFSEYLAAGIARVTPAQRFFLDVERPGSRTAERKAGRSLKSYSRWGFIGTERPAASVFSKRLVGTYDAASRRFIRHRLADRHGSFSLSEYLDALDNAVSRQQAYKDLASDAQFQLIGRGRGARWSKSRAVRDSR